ncbi:VOC family protein [Neomicrococcus lactis]|uniref:VOC family protein n=1 Tax=Neomicrococcus lactis TaxID=732241 RepID=UPI002301559C|nr:VOC family protein [Neomicrococcus lactis]
MKPLVTCLWFDGTASEAVRFYTGLFANSTSGAASAVAADHAGVAGQSEQEEPLVINFTINGQAFQALNGGPHYKPTPATSFVVSCKDQEEVDYYWDALTADGGEESMCGWLTDKYGFSWQIVPERLEELMTTSDAETQQRVVDAFMKMRKLDIAVIEAAATGSNSNS